MVDTARLVARVETKGVKRATDELDKLSKEAGKAEGSAKKLGAAFKGGAAAFAKVGVALGATAAALTALAVKTSEAQKEWQNLATLARTSVDDFKATAFAAEQVGISAEKLADISKDTNEKLGEFIATGGGGFKDFFDEVAPKVGLTAEELQGLSGPQVLGRVQQAFEDANVPIEQQSFFLESIASDTTALIPLLANESRELERLTSRYNDLNQQLQLSAGENGAVTQLSQSFNLLTQTSGNAAAKITATLAPTLDSFFSSVAESVPTATQALIDFFNVFIATENLTEIKVVQKRLDGINEQINKIRSGDRRSQQRASNELKSLKEEAAEAQAQIDKLTAAQEKLEDANTSSISGIRGGSGGGSNGLSSGRTSEFDAFSKEIRAISQTELELIDQQEQERIAKLDKFRAKGLASETEYKELLANIERDSADQRLELETEYLQRRSRLQDEFNEKQDRKQREYDQRQIEGRDKLLSDLASLASSGNKRLFRISQAAALAQSIISIQTGIAKAQELGFPLSIAATAAVAAQGAVQIAAIRNQQPPSARAQGGQFSRDQDLLVGEKGPELVRFNSGGRIATAEQTAALAGASSGPQVVVNNYAPGTRAKAETMSDGRVRVIVNEVLNAEVSQPNSQFNKNFDRTRKTERRF